MESHNMLITIMDVFYILMIITIFGFIVHLETQMKLILEMMKQRWTYETLDDEFNGNGESKFEKSLDNIDQK
jgi:hypothetical protein|tara:strand:- start:703 stop:918 length:216 start_codon:yes stop_codon:yes gene_type:complete